MHYYFSPDKTITLFHSLILYSDTIMASAVITPITVIIRLAFRRREQALLEIRRLRSSCFQIYLCHGIWDWRGNDIESSGRITAEYDWLQHTDKVLELLIRKRKVYNKVDKGKCVHCTTDSVHCSTHGAKGV